MLGYNKKYVALALNCILKNSKKIISILEIKRKNRNNNIKEEWNSWMSFHEWKMILLNMFTTC